MKVLSAGILCLACSTLLLLIGLPAAAAASADSTATGTLTLNKGKIKLSYASVDLLNPNEPIVVISDKPLPSDNFSIGLLSEGFIREKNVHALLLSISRKDRKLAGSLNFLYFPGEKTHFVNFGDQVALTITRLDDTVIEGRAVTPKPVVEEFSEVTFSLDAQFKASLVKPQVRKAPTEVSVTGDTSPPVMAYAEYYWACVEGDSERVRGFLSAQARRQFDSFDNESRDAFLYTCSTRPAQISVAARTPLEVGSMVSFSVAGATPAGERATGSVKMVLEEGQWRVMEDKWEFLSK